MKPTDALQVPHLPTLSCALRRSSPPWCSSYRGNGWTEVTLRLAAAMVIGGVIGLDRNLHHKPTGVRTLGLVALGSALALLTVGRDSQTDISRVVQGVITGVGFIGAGVILHRASATAAAIWVTAALGALCGLGSWHIILVAVICPPPPVWRLI
jgi:putative Mg2+ transporter-C (MgtC) family protein